MSSNSSSLGAPAFNGTTAWKKYPLKGAPKKEYGSAPVSSQFAAQHAQQLAQAPPLPTTYYLSRSLSLSLSSLKKKAQSRF